MRELIDLVNPAGLHTFSCRARTAFKLGHSCSVPVQTVLCLFAAISVFFCPWSDPWHQLWPWIWATDRACYQPMVLPSLLSPVGLHPLGEGMTCPGSLSLPLGSSWPLLLPGIRFLSMDFFFLPFFFSSYPNAFFVHNSTGLFDSQLIVTLGACL